MISRVAQQEAFPFPRGVRASAAAQHDVTAQGRRQGSRGWERFVQLVWRPTTEVGCGFKTGCPTPLAPLQPNTYVCRWNVMPRGGATERMTNVGPPSTNFDRSDLLELIQHNTTTPQRPSFEHATARGVRTWDRREAILKKRLAERAAVRSASDKTSNVLLPQRGPAT